MFLAWTELADLTGHDVFVQARPGRAGWQGGGAGGLESFARLRDSVATRPGAPAAAPFIVRAFMSIPYPPSVSRLTRS